MKEKRGQKPENEMQKTKHTLGRQIKKIKNSEFRVEKGEVKEKFAAIQRKNKYLKHHHRERAKRKIFELTLIGTPPLLSCYHVQKDTHLLQPTAVQFYLACAFYCNVIHLIKELFVNSSS